MATIPDPKEVFVGELARHGDWVVGNVDTTMAWPVTAGKFKSRGAQVWVLPLMQNMYPCIAMKRTGSLNTVNGC